MKRFETTSRVACLLLLCGACAKSEDDAGDMPAGGADAAMPDSGSGTGAPGSGAASGADAGGVMMGNLPGTIPSARGKCDIDSGFPGDEACLAPPDPDQGFQIHIGPNDYDDMAEIQKFLMQPGDESSECYMKKTPNDAEIHYFVYELSGRPGTHHIINTLLSNDLAEDWGTCTSFAPGGGSIGSLGGASRPHMPPMPVAPENAKLGIPLAAHTQGQHDMHYFNLTDQPILREFWMNIYYVDPDAIEELPQRIAGLGGLSWNFRPIQPGTHDVYDYECPIGQDGRIIQLLGHTHAHGIRETAHIRRANGDRVKVFEQYDYLEPQIFNFDSLTENPDFSDNLPGAWTGVLEVSAGDALEWECEINNDSETPLRYVNEVQTGEMCNIWGMTVGPTLSCYLQ